MVMAAPLIPAISGARAQLVELNANVRRFAPLHQGINPLTASAKDLADAGYPPRPDEETQPELFEVWKAGFGQAPTYEEVEFSQPFPDEPASYGGSTSAALGRSHREASSNWSGAYITPKYGEMFTQMAALWYVPTVTPPPGGSPTAAYGSSTWIGLDGQRSYFNSTLPQIGTAQFYNLPGLLGSTTEAWVQWWPLCPVTLTMKVVPGDLMSAWLVVTSYTKVQFVIVNVSRLKYTPFELDAPLVSMPPQVPLAVQASVSGATAEWVMERPAVCPDPNPMTLPSFPPVQFYACLAASAREPGAPIRVQTLVSPKLIRMFSVEENPHRAVTRAVATRPDLLDLTSATVTYRT
jgi:hypothetical protein